MVMKFKVKIRPFDIPILFTFAAMTVFFSAKLFCVKSESKTLMVQIGADKFAYSMEKELHLEFEGLLGKSHITVSKGEAWFDDSPCDNKICVESGKISRPNQWAACLPNGIIIYIEGISDSKKELDAIAN